MSQLLLQQPFELLFFSPDGERRPDFVAVWAYVGEEGGAAAAQLLPAGHRGQPIYMDMEFIILKKV